MFWETSTKKMSSAKVWYQEIWSKEANYVEDKDVVLTNLQNNVPSFVLWKALDQIQNPHRSILQIIYWITSA